MSGTLPTIAILDTSPESPSNTAFRPFRTIDLVGGTAELALAVLRCV